MPRQPKPPLKRDCDTCQHRAVLTASTLCTHENARRNGMGMVRDWFESADKMREKPRQCAPDAKWWEPKPRERAPADAL